MSQNLEVNNKIMEILRDSIPIFTVLADEERQRIILILAETTKGVSVSEITERMTLSRPAVSHHLKLLKQTGIVNFEKEGKENRYFLTLKKGVELLKILTTMLESECELI